MLPLLATLLRNYTSSLHRRDGVTAAFSARNNNNNSTLPTKLLELSSEDFLLGSICFVNGTAP